MFMKGTYRLGLAAAMFVAAPQAFAQDDTQASAAARTTVDYLFPEGSYARLMKSSMDAMMGPMMESISSLPMRDLAQMAGVPEERLLKLDEETLGEVTEILDPHYKERFTVSMNAMMGGMSGLMTQFEPAMRDGLTEAYANRFSASQLAEINAFFATPTGSAYAAESMAIFMDPAVVGKMQEMIPAMMEQIPALTQDMMEATADLPPPRQPSDLSEAERARLAELLGVEVDDLRDAPLAEG